MNNKHNIKKSFTLIEVLIAIAVLGIVAISTTSSIISSYKSINRIMVESYLNTVSLESISKVKAISLSNIESIPDVTTNNEYYRYNSNLSIFENQTFYYDQEIMNQNDLNSFCKNNINSCNLVNYELNNNTYLGYFYKTYRFVRLNCGDDDCPIIATVYIGCKEKCTNFTKVTTLIVNE